MVCHRGVLGQSWRGDSVNAGRLRHMVEVQQNAPTRDTGGGSVDSWSTVTNGRRPAEIVPVTGLKEYVDNQLQETITHKVTMRYLAGVTTANRILFGSRVFDIRSVVNPQERGRDLILLVFERLAS